MKNPNAVKKPYPWTRVKYPVSFRLTSDDFKVLDRISLRLKLSRSEVLLRALRNYGEQVLCANNNKPSSSN